MTRMAVRLPDELVARVHAIAKASNTSRSEVIRHALERYLYRLACERDAAVYDRQPLTEEELVLANDRDAWSATPGW